MKTTKVAPKRKPRDRHKAISDRRIALEIALRSWPMTTESGKAAHGLLDHLAFELDLVIYEIEELKAKR